MRDEDGHQGDQQHHGATDPDQFFLRCVLAQEGAIDVFRQRAGAHQQLAGQRAHHGSQDGGQQAAGDPGVEQLLGQFHEHRFGVGVDGGGAFRMGHEVRDADKADGDRAHQAQNHPRHADSAGIGNGFHRGGCHEAHQDVRLAEVAQAPGQQRDDAGEGGALHDVELFDRHHGGPVLAGLQLALHGQIGHDGRQDQRGDHHGGLDGIRPAHGQEAADEHVGDGAEGAHPQSGFIGHAEHVLEQARASHHAGSAVDGEEDQDHQRGENAQDVGLVLETAGEIVGQRQGVAGALGVQAQAGSDEAPVQVGADDQADGNPRFGQAGQVDGAGQAHQQPAAHVGGAGRQRSNEAAEAATTQNVVGQVLGTGIAKPANAEHGHQVDGEHDRGGIAPVQGHGSLQERGRL